MFTRVDPEPGSLLSTDAVAQAMAMHWPVAVAEGHEEVDDGEDDEATLEAIEDESAERAAAAFWPARLEQYVQVEMDNRRAEFAAVDPDDSDELAALLRRWLTDPGLRRRWRAAALDARPHLRTWDAAASDLARCLTD